MKRGRPSLLIWKSCLTAFPEKIKEDNSLFPHLLEGIQPKLRLPWAESADEDMERILMGEESLPLK